MFKKKKEKESHKHTPTHTHALTSLLKPAAHLTTMPKVPSTTSKHVLTHKHHQTPLTKTNVVILRVAELKLTL